ncbi:hypothetical protein BFW01_g8936 [Lasiodiplodia theobromae]|nr:hypothetical protein BFW01_g8936 [Lasiodiplodia theobromae]
MFDDEHELPADFAKHPSDTNQYCLGRIGQHNVVMTWIAAGEYGTTAAATTASNMLSSFPHIRIGLMVGVGAGLPRVKDKRVLKEYDIRLGDVVISEPKGTSSGVVQYDLGKIKEGKFERVGFLGAPPEVLRKGLNSLKMHHQKNGSGVPDILQKMVEKYPRLGRYNPENEKHGFVYQGAQYDRLFDASALHVDAPDDEDDPERSCSHCDTELEIQRKPRPFSGPRFHYGIIASGNLVVKDRDMILQRLSEDCLCFEMEAAGLMNHFPCLVIRGICDYADTHKNDRWQNYAAATAAAFAKELLQILQYHEVESEHSMREVLGYSQ